MNDDVKHLLSEFNAELSAFRAIELRGKYGRKGQRGGSSKEPTASSSSSDSYRYKPSTPAEWKKEQRAFRKKNGVKLDSEGERPTKFDSIKSVLSFAKKNGWIVTYNHIHFPPKKIIDYAEAGGKFFQIFDKTGKVGIASVKITDKNVDDFIEVEYRKIK